MECLHARYQRVVIMHPGRGKMTNATLKTRLGLPTGNSGITCASDIIKLALGNGLIRPFDSNRSCSGYVPNRPRTFNGI